MAAADAFHIAQNQPFVDGNKRTGLTAALVFLDLVPRALRGDHRRPWQLRGEVDRRRHVAEPAHALDPGRSSHHGGEAKLKDSSRRSMAAPAAPALHRRVDRAGLLYLKQTGTGAMGWIRVA